MRWSPRECPFNTWFMSRQHGQRSRSLTHSAFPANQFNQSQRGPPPLHHMKLRNFFSFYILFVIRQPDLGNAPWLCEIMKRFVLTSWGFIDDVFGTFYADSHWLPILLYPLFIAHSGRAAVCGHVLMAGDHCVKKGFFFSALSSLSLWSWDVWGLSHLCSLSRRHFDERGGPVYYSRTQRLELMILIIN